ncbi:MAG: DUF167 domain-containing protein [Gammaproteobacteria bacterium]|nr:DUF167 domain-containing protein [Gammaproteobacteria bacterium]
MWYRREADEIVINVYAQPGAKHTEVAGLHGDALKIRLNTPPVDGRANDALIAYLAAQFKVPVRQVSLRRGEKSRHKVIVIKGSQVNPDDLYRL